HGASVMRKSGEDGEGRCAVEQVVRVEDRNVGVRLGIGRNPKVRINAENLPYGNSGVREVGNIEIHLAHHVSAGGGLTSTPNLLHANFAYCLTALYAAGRFRPTSQML